MPPKSKQSRVAAGQRPMAKKPTRAHWKTIALAASFMGLAAFASPVSQANLSPVYGSIPAAAFHRMGVSITVLLGLMVGNTSMKKYFRRDLRQFIPVLAYYVPLIQWLLFPYSAKLGPEYGPLVMESITYYPILFMACIATSFVLEDLNLSSPGIAPTLSYTGFFLAESLSSSALPLILGKNDFFTRSGLQLLIASFYAALSKAPYLLAVIPAMLHTMYANPHYYSNAGFKVLNRTLNANNFTILERMDSLTGYISVLESHENEYRVLRCDHSLLGGDWLVNESRAKQGQIGRESIYSVFTMLESVRLVEGISTKPDAEKNALFVGLGIGTSPTAFIKHGINTTIVELDPAVHYFAMKYFDLPGNHTVAIEDAVVFVGTESIDHPKSYDYIVHDVFTGGAEPTSLFTLEFLQGLDGLLKDDGVVAINYAGDLTMPPPKIILDTIHTVFPTCRIFRDSPESEDEPNNTFINMVVFCTKSIDKPLTFRKPTRADWMGSLSRREFIPPAETLEIHMADIHGEVKWKTQEILKRGEEAKIEKYHKEAAIRHWKIMRTVLPDAIWENW
ncbi:putative oxalate decarboxylase [Venturia inaequalis]|nr:putative oxalate decarboxylase [Venturia inaequalis]